MLDLARHIIATKQGSFDPAAFDDRYDAALAELVKAKIEGREIRKPKRKAEGKVIDLMEALRESAAAASKAKKPAAKTAPRRKAG
jgi:DNA end-binding protein Ku